LVASLLLIGATAALVITLIAAKVGYEPPLGLVYASSILYLPALHRLLVSDVSVMRLLMRQFEVGAPT
jgi:hypothetical protein